MSFHVRRKDREITDQDEMRHVLKATKYVTVAFCMQDEPYLVSLSHGYDQTQNCLYFHCAPEGKKLIYAKTNSKVWGQGSNLTSALLKNVIMLMHRFTSAENSVLSLTYPRNVTPWKFLFDKSL